MRIVACASWAMVEPYESTMALPSDHTPVGAGDTAGAARLKDGWAVTSAMRASIVAWLEA